MPRSRRWAQGPSDRPRPQAASLWFGSPHAEGCGGRGARRSSLHLQPEPLHCRLETLQGSPGDRGNRSRAHESGLVRVPRTHRLLPIHPRVREAPESNGLRRWSSRPPATSRKLRVTGSPAGPTQTAPPSRLRGLAVRPSGSSAPDRGTCQSTCPSTVTWGRAPCGYARCYASEAEGGRDSHQRLRGYNLDARLNAEPGRGPERTALGRRCL